MRLLRRFTHSSIATKDFNTTTKHVASLKKSLVPRFFHPSPVYYSNGNFGSPCACSECMQDQRKPICEICTVRPTVHQSYEDSHDRKGIRSYSFVSFCEQCWQKCETARREKEEKEEQILASNKARINSMMNIMQEIHSTEQISIARAVDKLITKVRSVKNFSNSRRWFQRHLIHCLSKELQIVKIRKYMCNKQRVDAMDFKLWYFADRPYYEM